MEASRKRELCKALTERLVQERQAHGLALDGTLAQIVPTTAGELDAASTEQLWLAFRALVNVREPWKADEAFLAEQDELLQGLIAEAGVSTLSDAVPSPHDARLSLWRGDITTFAADVIVNAANSRMTGCWAPLHYCIDNAIHTFAGVQLRIECAEIMRRQGHPEPTGQAKLTDAYNLPARHIAHTVGPISDGRDTPELRGMLASSYRSCLEATAQAGGASIVFCCISTGVFGFPADVAAPLAVDTVRDWLDAHPDTGVRNVVFNVFGENDENRYRRLLGLGE